MTYLVNGKCIKCKYMDCIEVCPVDCFHEGPDMLVIDPEVCIDCGVCEAECPIGAIIPDSASKTTQLVEFNHKYAKQWPVIVKKGTPPQDADEWREVDEDAKWQQFYPDQIISLHLKKS